MILLKEQPRKVMQLNEYFKSRRQIFVDLAICVILVLLFFLPTLNRPWLFYDENAIYDETFVPVPRTFGEIF